MKETNAGRWRKALLLAAAGGLVYLLIPKPQLLDGLSYSQAFYDRNGKLLRLTLSSDDKYRLRLSMDKIAALSVEATLLQEDRGFYRHPGVNPLSLVRSAWKTYFGGRRMGGSTITMQVARIRYGINSRTFSGKLAQIFRALQIERHYSKKEIIEAYLNLVSYGGNIEGIGAASLVYFGKPAAKLNLAEACYLVVIPQHPAKRTPTLNAGGTNAVTLSEARLRLLEMWLKKHSEVKEQDQILKMPLHLKSALDLPFSAPHFVNALTGDRRSEGDIITTLDLSLQRTLERQIANYIEHKSRLRIKNAAAMLVDYRNMEVRALAGSADFFNDGIQGQVNGARAQRSPGSTLKPVIYALGMDQGIIHPLTMLKDAPVSYSGYNPENFDREFAGPIKARDALIRSRNIPAVQVAAKLSNPTLYQFLEKAGVANLKEESFYGLALVLGGAEMTMEDIVKLYAMLANGGFYKPLKNRTGEPMAEGLRMLSSEACFLTLDMLKDNPRPAQGFRNDWTRDSFPVYWKTGTSFAFRDAWSVGIFGHYVLAVWLGNFDGESNPALIGIETAAPLFFHILDAVKSHEKMSEPNFWTINMNLAKVDVCAVSGSIPGPYCKHRVSTWFIPGVSPIKTCDIHRAVDIDIHTGQRSCGGGAGTRREIFEFWPSDLLRLFKQAGIPRRTPPPDAPGCSLDKKSASGIAPQITSPQLGVVYSLRSRAADGETIPLTAVTDADVREVYWFADEKYIGKSGGDRSFFWKPKPGNYVVRAVDDQGRSDSRELNVSIVD